MQTHGMRRKSTSSIFEVNVKTAVMLEIRPFCFLALIALDCSTARLHSMDSSTSTGPSPPLEDTPVSVIDTEYCGNSLADARTSKPKGDRRFKSYISIRIRWFRNSDFYILFQF